MNRQLPSRLNRVERGDKTPPELFDLLREGTRLGLQRAIELLAASPDPGDRNYASILRAQTSLVNTFINAVARVEKLGYNVTVVPSGKRAFPLHNEEMFFILEGEGEARIGDKTYPIKKGDFLSADGFRFLGRVDQSLTLLGRGVRGRGHARIGGRVKPRNDCRHNPVSASIRACATSRPAEVSSKERHDYDLCLQVGAAVRVGADLRVRWALEEAGLA